MGKAFERIKQGLNEAIGDAKGKQAGVKVWRPAAVDVAEPPLLATAPAGVGIRLPAGAHRPG